MTIVCRPWLPGLNWQHFPIKLYAAYSQEPGVKSSQHTWTSSKDNILAPPTPSSLEPGSSSALKDYTLWLLFMFIPGLCLKPFLCCILWSQSWQILRRIWTKFHIMWSPMSSVAPMLVHLVVDLQHSLMLLETKEGKLITEKKDCLLLG